MRQCEGRKVHARGWRVVLDDLWAQRVAHDVSNSNSTSEAGTNTVICSHLSMQSYSNSNRRKIYCGANILPLRCRVEYRRDHYLLPLPKKPKNEPRPNFLK